MKRNIATVLALAALVSNAFAVELEWMTDPAKAFAEAARRKVPVLVDFSGSDWCTWCIKLDKDVFSTDVFKDYAKDKFVFLLVDFPYHTAQPAEQQKSNRALAEQYGVEGFPTVLLLDASGKVLARTGYRRGGPQVYVKHLEALLPGKVSEI